MHAGQAATVNRELAPSPAELDWARDVIAQFGEDGSNVRDGSDLPRLSKARKIIAAAAVFAISEPSNCL
jgi:citrate lyase subunit beta/citryl-CoA lyase